MSDLGNVIITLREEITKLTKVRAALLAVVEAVEWVGRGDCNRYCPKCGAWYVGGKHRPDCQLDATLRLARGER